MSIEDFKNLTFLGKFCRGVTDEKMSARTSPPRRGRAPGWSGGRVGRCLALAGGWLAPCGSAWMPCHLLPFVTLDAGLLVTVGLVIRGSPLISACLLGERAANQPSASFTTRPRP